MKFFELFDDMKSPRRWHIGQVRLPDGTVPFLDGGIRLDNPDRLHAEVHQVGLVLKFCLTSFGVPIASKEIADTVSSIVGSDVQCLPITLSGQTAMMVLNAIRLIRCIDEQQSEYLKWTKNDHRADLAGQYRQVSKLVLNRNSIPPDAHFFRIKDWEVALIVSETVKNAMERVGCYGAKFTELEMV